MTLGGETAKNLCVLSVLRGFILINRRARRVRKGFGNGSHTNALPPTLCVLSVLRGSILLTAEHAETAKDSIMASIPMLFPMTLSAFFSVLRGSILLTAGPAEFKGFGKGFHTCAIPMNLCVLSVLH